MSFAYMPLYTGDYLRDTKHLTPEEHGIYLLLLIHCWDQRGPIPLDERRQCGIVNARSGGEIESLRRVLAEFFIRMDDGWYNRRMMEEVARCESISSVRRKGGLEKARRMRDKVRDAEHNDAQQRAQAVLEQYSSSARPVLEQVSPSPSPSPSPTSSPEPTSSPVSGELFQEAALPLSQKKLLTSWKKKEGEEERESVRERGGVGGKEMFARSSASRATRIQVAVLPENWRLFCRQKRPDLDPDETFERFRDHWLAQPGQKGVKVDWDATWRNWCRNEPYGKGGRIGRASKQAALEARNKAVADEFAAQGGGDDDAAA